MTHSYTLTESCTYTDDKFWTSMDKFWANFITWLLHLLIGKGFGSVSWEQLFFYWFQGRNLLAMIKISKGVGISKKERVKYQGGRGFKPLCLLSDSNYGNQKNLSRPTWNIFFKMTFIRGKLLRSLGYNDKLIQKQKRISTYCKKCTEQRFWKHWIF